VDSQGATLFAAGRCLLAIARSCLGSGDIGHDLPQEAPEAFAKAVIVSGASGLRSRRSSRRLGGPSSVRSRCALLGCLPEKKLLLPLSHLQVPGDPAAKDFDMFIQPSRLC